MGGPKAIWPGSVTLSCRVFMPLLAMSTEFGSVTNSKTRRSPCGNLYHRPKAGLSICFCLLVVADRVRE